MCNLSYLVLLMLTLGGASASLLVGDPEDYLLGFLVALTGASSMAILFGEIHILV